MINLIKKDLRACFKADLKTIAKLAIGILLFSFLLFPIAGITIPLFISYIFIFRSFYLDELNKCDYFFNSMPIEKEDIVYGKYLFSMIVIVASLIFAFIYTKLLKGIWYVDIITIEIALITISIVLLLVSICMPIVFKYGYNKSYVIANLIVIGTGLVTMFSTFRPSSQVWADTATDMLVEPKYLILSGASILAYIISMYISIKIYTKKEIAN